VIRRQTFYYSILEYLHGVDAGAKDKKGDVEIVENARVLGHAKSIDPQAASKGKGNQADNLSRQQKDKRCKSQRHLAYHQVDIFHPPELFNALFIASDRVHLSLGINSRLMVRIVQFPGI